MPVSRVPKLKISKKTAPPEWALLELTLLKTQSDACREFFDRYFDGQGYLDCVPRWGGNDGPDDAAENFLNWTILHALGGPDDILDMYTTAWEGHLRQYTEAKTTSVPLATDGMYYREFPVMFDWFHHGEWLSAFILEGREYFREHQSGVDVWAGPVKSNECLGEAFLAVCVAIGGEQPFEARHVERGGRVPPEKILAHWFNPRGSWLTVWWVAAPGHRRQRRILPSTSTRSLILRNA